MTDLNIRCENCGQNFDFDPTIWTGDKIDMWLDGWTAANPQINCNHKWKVTDATKV